MPKLIILSGDQPGRAFALAGDRPITIGREAGSTLQLKDESVSRVHAIVEFASETWRIQDQASLNGTFVNSVEVEHRELESGDLIRIGEFLLLFAADSDTTGIFDPLQLADSTRVKRIIGAEKQRVADDPVGADSTSGPVRKLSFLYRLSREMYRVSGVEELCKYALRSAMEVVSASAGRIAIRTHSGRLQTYWIGESTPNETSAQVLSNWVIERDEAILLDIHKGDLEWKKTLHEPEDGTAIVVPVPSSLTPVGSIELFEPSEKKSFSNADLEFMVSVAQQLGMAIEWLQRMRRVEQANDQLREQLSCTRVNLIGECTAIQELKRQLVRVAATNVTTLLLGESGTGKEVASRSIHELSPRQKGPFVAVNCAAFNEGLLESELFGHERGAFTGADKQRIGQFERANTGTIFLDEIGEMSLNCQAKVLRLLEGQPFERVGGSQPVETDVRIIAATNRDLERMVADNLFREDLLFRLRVVELSMPALRERGEDIVTLAEHFLDQLASEIGVSNLRFSPEAIQTMRQHNWPGNVRELRNAVERGIVLRSQEVIVAEDLGLKLGTIRQGNSSEQKPLPLAVVERQHIQHVLTVTGGNKSRACEILEIPRSSLYNKLKEEKGK